MQLARAQVWLELPRLFHPLRHQLTIHRPTLPSPNTAPRFLTVDDQFVYWTNGDASLRRAPKAGGQASAAGEGMNAKLRNDGRELRSRWWMR